MSRKNRSVLLFSLVPAVLLGSVSGRRRRQRITPAKATKWSSPATWPNRKVPAAGDKVVIDAGKEVILDVSPPALNGLTINGKLTFADNADVELTTEWIMIHGELAIGTEAKPHTRKATITLTDNVKDEEMMGMGDRGIMLAGGTLNLHGDRTHTWTKLASTAEAGATSIEVLNAAGWRVGDEIVLASTDYDPRQAERRTITAISGNTITLDKKLDYMHFGKITFDVDERGEVGLLTRNIKIQASEDAAQSYFGGHIMAMVTSKMFVEGVELNRMGQHMELARYPIHWHLVGDVQGPVHPQRRHPRHLQPLRDRARHEQPARREQRDLQHRRSLLLPRRRHRDRQRVRQEPGHPDQVPSHQEVRADQSRRQRRERLHVRESPGGQEDQLLRQGHPAAFGQHGGVASGSPIRTTPSSTMWPPVPTRTASGCRCRSTRTARSWARIRARTPGHVEPELREFKGNVAHSNFDGFMFDRNINVDNTFGLAGNAYWPKENPADPNSKSLETHFENLTTYKNRNGGFWGRGELFVVRNLKTADNAIGFTMSSGAFGREAFTSLVVDSLFVGETENIGNPVTPEEKAYGRSLPKRAIPDFPIHGYEYYDYRVDVANTTFVNYQDNKQREAGALSWLLFTSSGVTTENTIKGAKYVNAKPVHFPKYDSRFDNDNRGGSAYRTLAIHDLDGTTTGVNNSYVLLHDGEFDSPATDDTCKIQPTWNASVCTGDVGRLYFRGFGPPAASPTRWWLNPGAGPAQQIAGCRCCSACETARAAHRCCSQWQGIQDHGQPEHRARRHRDPGEDRKTRSLSLLE